MALRRVLNVAAAVLWLCLPLVLAVMLLGISVLALRHVVLVTGPFDGFPLLMLAAVGLGALMWLARLGWRHS